MNKNRTTSTPIGYQQDAFWINMKNLTSDNPTIIYPAAGPERLTVELICDRSISAHHLSVERVFYQTYQMQLRGPCACWDGCTHSHHPHNHSLTDDWEFWTILGSIAIAFFLLFCCLFSCLFCSKPKRNHAFMIVTEKTPFLSRSINSYEKI